MKNIFVVTCLLFAFDSFAHADHGAEMTVTKMWEAFEKSDVELFSMNFTALSDNSSVKYFLVSILLPLS